MKKETAIKLVIGALIGSAVTFFAVKQYDRIKSTEIPESSESSSE